MKIAHALAGSELRTVPQTHRMRPSHFGDPQNTTPVLRKLVNAKKRAQDSIRPAYHPSQRARENRFPQMLLRARKFAPSKSSAQFMDRPHVILLPETFSRRSHQPGGWFWWTPSPAAKARIQFLPYGS